MTSTPVPSLFVILLLPRWIAEPTTDLRNSLPDSSKRREPNRIRSAHPPALFVSVVLCHLQPDGTRPTSLLLNVSSASNHGDFRPHLVSRFISRSASDLLAASLRAYPMHSRARSVFLSPADVHDLIGARGQPQPFRIELLTADPLHLSEQTASFRCLPSFCGISSMLRDRLFSSQTSSPECTSDHPPPNRASSMLAAIPVRHGLPISTRTQRPCPSAIRLPTDPSALFKPLVPVCFVPSQPWSITIVLSPLRRASSRSCRALRVCLRARMCIRPILLRRADFFPPCLVPVPPRA